jgi:hypothetical protein
LSRLTGFLAELQRVTSCAYEKHVPDSELSPLPTFGFHSREQVHQDESRFTGGEAIGTEAGSDSEVDTDSDSDSEVRAAETGAISDLQG